MFKSFRNIQFGRSSVTDDGAALISALLIVSVMSITALVVIDNLRYSIKLATNLNQREQARLYALGAEQLAKETINAARKISRSQEEPRYPELDEWTKNPVFFPIEGGSITGKIKDGANCFNLNAVVTYGEDNSLVSDQYSAQKMIRMLEYLGISSGESLSLVNSLIDWIDSDSVPSYGGAEDPYYSIEEPSFRTGHTFLADVSELNVIRGYTPALIETLKPWVCVRQTDELQTINVNTITPEDMPLMLAYLGSEFDEVSVNNILAERPVTGFNSIQDFFSLPIFEETKIPDEDVGLYGLSSKSYEVIAQINYFQTAISLHSVLQISNAGGITIASRRYGTF